MTYIFKSLFFWLYGEWSEENKAKMKRRRLVRRLSVD